MVLDEVMYLTEYKQSNLSKEMEKKRKNSKRMEKNKCYEKQKKFQTL